MTATGAATPVQSSKLLAPCRTSASSPSITSQPAARGRPDERGLGVAVSVREVDDGLARARLDEEPVAHGRRVHDQVAPVGVRRPDAAPAERARVGRQRGGERPRGAAGADQAGPGRDDAGEDLPVGVVPEHAAVPEHERIDGVPVGAVAHGDDCLLVRDRHVRTGEPERAERGDRRQRLIDVERRVVPVEPGSSERGVLHPRREGVRDRVPEERDLRRHPYPWASRYRSKAAALAVKKWCTWSGLRTK